MVVRLVEGAEVVGSLPVGTGMESAGAEERLVELVEEAGPSTEVASSDGMGLWALLGVEQGHPRRVDEVDRREIVGSGPPGDVPPRNRAVLPWSPS